MHFQRILAGMAAIALLGGSAAFAQDALKTPDPGAAASQLADPSRQAPPEFQPAEAPASSVDEVKKDAEDLDEKAKAKKEQKDAKKKGMLSPEGVTPAGMAAPVTAPSEPAEAPAAGN